MTKQFVILCSAQRLRYQDGSDDTGPYYAFGLNLSAAIGIDDPRITVTSNEVGSLRPWLWTEIDEVAAATADDGSDAFVCKVIKPPTPLPDLDWTTLITQLNGEYSENAADLSVATWMLPDMAAERRIQKRVIVNLHPKPNAVGQMKPWHASIMQLSTYPYPIPQRLNLSFIVKVPRDQMNAKETLPLYLAPIIKTDVDTVKVHFAADTKPTGSITQVDDRKIYRWGYDQPSVSGLEIFAYVKPVVVREQTSSPPTYIDLDTGWVRSVDRGNHYEEDWRSYLESKMAEAFDISELLLDYLRDNIGSLSIEVMPFFQRMVVSSLRDIAGTGLIPSINGNTLPDDLLGPDPANKLPANRLNDIRAVERELFGSGDPLDHSWRTFLAKTIPELAGLAILDPAHREERRRPEDCLADLERLHKALLDQQNLQAVVQNQWKMIFAKLDETIHRPISGWDQASLDKLAEFRKKLTELSPNFNYRSRLANCSLGPIWKALQEISANNIDSPLDIRQLFPALLASHVQARFQLTPEETHVVATDYANYHPAFDGKQDTTLVNRIVSAVRTKAPAIANGILPADGQTDKTTDVPHPIALQAHLTTMLPKEDKAFENILNQISGVLVLMRDREHRVWHCLNYAQATVREGSGNRVNALTVPTRINYQNNLSQSLVTYNNVPLIAPSPLAQIPVKNENTVIAPTDKLLTNQEHRKPLIKYDYFKNPQNPDDPRSKIQPLVFRNPTTPAGQYDALICTVSTSGALPSELTVRTNPWQIDQTKLQALNFGASSGLVRPFSYVRKVRVGQIRSHTTKLVPGQPLPGATVNNVLNLPSVPDLVHPRALELPSITVQGKPRLLGNELPLILLAPISSDDWSVPTGEGVRKRWDRSFEFSLRKPATDVETWHRWTNQGETNKAWRAAVLADYYDKNERNRNLPPDTVRSDISFDDPAVNGFHVSVKKFSSDQTWQPVGNPRPVTLPPRPTTQTLSDVQSTPLRVICNGGSNEGVSEAGGVVTINGLEGEIYWVQIFPTILRSERPRFARFLHSELEEVTGRNFVLGKPFEVLVEVATNRLPTAADIWNSVTPKFSDDSLGHRIEVKLLSNEPRFRNVYRAELQRQSWYWRGRETKEFPSLTAAPFEFVNPDLRDPLNPSQPGISDAVRAWEEFEFAGRDESDFTVIDFKPGSKTSVDGKRELFVFTEQLTPPITDEKPSDGSREKGDLRANYYRFSARVFSRYEGILTKSTFETASNPALNNDPLAKWRRLRVPCRRRETPPVPQVKLILPLTENHLENTDQKKRSPGLLVVLNETWHEFGGLGEGIVAEVETLADPNNTSTYPCGTNPAVPVRNRFYFELGPDPILDGRSNPLVQKGDDGNPVTNVSLAGIRGPVGHTHDSVDEGALFTSTSFVIPAPKIASANGGAAPPVEDLAWYMAKIRLRRIVRLKGSRNTDPDAELRSDFTPAQWVQYLPDFSLFSNARHTRDLAVRVTGAAISLVTRVGETPILEQQLSGPIEAATPVFKNLLLLTRHAYDVSGRRNQEVFVGLCTGGEDGVWNLISGDTSDMELSALASTRDVRFRARVVELQAVPNGTPPSVTFPPLPATTNELFDLLFATKAADQTVIDDLRRPRVVRISSPIEDVRQRHEATTQNIAGGENG